MTTSTEHKRTGHTPADWTEPYPIGSVWKFSGNVWGNGKAIVIGYNTGSKGTKSIWVIQISDDGEDRVVCDSLYENQKFVLRKRLNEPPSVDALLGWQARPNTKQETGR